MSTYLNYSKIFMWVMAFALVVFISKCQDQKSIMSPDIAAPVVISTDPVDAATGVAVNSKIMATFDEDIKSETINTETFLVRQGTTPVIGTVSYSGKIATFTPSANLENNALFTVLITGVRDLPGNMIEDQFIWNFTTSAATDTGSPVVLSTIPVNAAINVSISSKLTAAFNKEMDPSTISTTTFTVKGPGQNPVAGTVEYDVQSMSAVFTPTGNLAANTAFGATITTGAKDLAGHALASDFVWYFTTGALSDTTAPEVISTIPVNAATDVSISSILTASFNKAIDPTTITTATFTVKGPGQTSVTGTVTYDVQNMSAVFTPAGNLAANTSFSAMITTAVKDLAGNALASNFTWSFTTGSLPDTTAPTVSSTYPLNAATNIVITSNLNVTFSEAMNPLTINKNTFLVRQGTTPVIGTLTYSGTSAIFRPSGNLGFNAVYTATITDEATDLAGNALASDFVWYFNTGAIPDTTAPTVVVTIPVNAAIGVPINSKLTANFSEAMTLSTITTTTFTVKGPGGTPVTGTVDYNAPNMSAVFTPAGNLAASTIYTATITTGATGQHGNALASDFAWSFTTGAAPDTTKPMVNSTIPVNAATGVSVTSELYATFSEAMDPLTITTANITLRTGTTAIIGTITYSGVTAKFTPVGNLGFNTVYTAIITNAVKDLAGNMLASDFVWTFTTGAAGDTTAPTVLSTNPVNEATDISITSKLTATFSEPMTPTTLNTATFTVKGPGETPVSGSVIYAAASNSAIFTPSSNLAPNVKFTAIITTGATGLNGNALASNYIWTFTTSVSADTGKPTVLSTLPTDNTQHVDVRTNISATFSEAMDPLTITPENFIVQWGPNIYNGTLTFSGNTATYNPINNLPPGTEITTTITTGVKDLAGNSLAGNYVWSFATGLLPDTSAPQVSTTNPVNAATNVVIGSNVTAFFSQAMAPSTITTTSFTVKGPGANPVNGTVVYDAQSSSAVFDPASNLAFNTTYTAAITTDAQNLEDKALASDFEWSFTTDSNPDTAKPEVLSTIPVNAAIGVNVNNNLFATFNESMDLSTINASTFTLQKGLISVSGSVSYAGVTATFDPSLALDFNTVYTATITTGAKDLAGNALASDYVWTFTTAIEVVGGGQARR